MTTVAEFLVQALHQHEVKQIWGVVGDALNPVTDAIRRTDGLEWIGVRHEEAAAFAASAQSQLSGTIGVCMGTVGPGAIHLLNGLYDAKKSHAPVLAICGQVPSAEMGSDFFQEVNNDALFADVSVYCHTVTSAAQLPGVLEHAVNTAYAQRGVAVLTLPGDIGELDMDDEAQPPVFVRHDQPGAAADVAIAAVRDELAGEKSKRPNVTMLVGCGASQARDEVLELADILAAPMVLTLKAKPVLEKDNPFQVGQSGLLGNPAAAKALDDCDVLLMIGTDFPYSEWYPKHKTVIQIDAEGSHIGRRTPVDFPLTGDARTTVVRLTEGLKRNKNRDHLQAATKEYAAWRESQAKLIDPAHDKGLLGKVRAKFDNPDQRIRPEVVAATVDRLAADDAIFSSDTGMSTVWLSRFVTMRGDRQLIGSYNLGSMANAMPQTLGAQGLNRQRQVIGFCGDGGLMMLLGDLRTAVTYRLPVKLFVFNNGRLGMVKLEQEQGGLPEFGTELDNPDLSAVAQAMGLAARQVHDPAHVDEAVAWALTQPGPVLIDMVTNPDEISLPPKVKLAQGWGFAIAKSKEVLSSRS